MNGHRAGRGGPAGRDLRRRHGALGTDQNFILTGVPEDRVDDLLAEDLLQKYSPYPGPFTGAWWPARGPSSAASPSSRRRSGPSSGPGSSTSSWPATPVGRDPAGGPGAGEDAGVIRMHFSGCSASCAQPQIADIGFRGEIAHVGDHLVEAVDIGVGGSLGTDAGFIDWVEHARPVDDVPDACCGWSAATRRSGARASPSTSGPGARPTTSCARPWRRDAGTDDSGRRRCAPMKGYRIREEMNGIAEPPGKTWFWELEAGVIDADRCIQCGTCVAACPSNSIGVDEDTEPARAGQDVHRVLAVLGLLPPGRAALRGAVAAVDRASGDGRGRRRRWWSRPTPPTPTGRSPAAPRATGSAPCSTRYAVRAGARPDEAQDGGVVTRHARRRPGRRGHRRGARDQAERGPRRAVEGRGHLATTAKEIIDAAGSYYNQTMALAELDLTRYDLPGQAPHRRGRHALRDPGAPGHAGAAVADRGPPRRRRGAHHRPPVHQELRLRGPDAAASCATSAGIDLDRVSKVDVIHGRMIVEYRDGEVAVDEPIKDFHGAALKGCDECADFLGRGADLSVGSVGSMDGWTQRAGAHRSGAGGPSTGPGAGSTSGSSTIPRHWSSWTASTSGSPIDSLRRKLRPRRAPVHRLRRARRRPTRAPTGPRWSPTAEPVATDRHRVPPSGRRSTPVPCRIASGSVGRRRPARGG